MAAIWVLWVPIWSAVARAPTASTSPARPARGADHPLQSPRAAHRSADDGRDLGDAQRGQRGDVRLHLVAHRDQRKARAPRLSVRASELGPVEPRQPPSTLVATAHQRSVSIGAPGPATPSHQPASDAGPGRPGDVRITGERVQHHHHVVAARATARPSAGRRCRRRRSPRRSRVVSEPMSTTPISPSAGSVWVGSSEIVSRGSVRKPPRRADRGVRVGQRRPRRSRARGRPGCRRCPRCPTASRTRPGRHAGGQLLLGGQLRVGRGRGVDHQRAHIADVGDVAVQFQRVRRTPCPPRRRRPARTPARAPVPLGASFFARSCHGELGSPA